MENRFTGKIFLQYLQRYPFPEDVCVRCSVIVFSKPKLQKDLCFGEQEWFCEWSALSQEQLNMEVSQYGCSQMVGQ